MLETRTRQEADILRHQQRTGKDDGEKSGMVKLYIVISYSYSFTGKEWGETINQSISVHYSHIFDKTSVMHHWGWQPDVKVFWFPSFWILQLAQNKHHIIYAEQHNIYTASLSLVLTALNTIISVWRAILKCGLGQRNHRASQSGPCCWSEAKYRAFKDKTMQACHNTAG